MSEEPLHLPVLRHGAPYLSLDTYAIESCDGGGTLGTVSLANRALIERDLEEWSKPAQELAAYTTAQILERARAVAKIFEEEALPVFPGGPSRSMAEHVDVVSQSTGLPKHIVRVHMKNIVTAWTRLADTIDGLTRGLAPVVLDGTKLRQQGRLTRVVQVARSLAVILPNNAPSVHGLWLPALALRTPVALKPGHAEPWTAYRIHAAWVAAGMPSSSISIYPTTHQAVPTLVKSADRAMVFGDQNSVRPYLNRADVQVHGPGNSTLIFDDDAADDWSRYFELIDDSVLYNGGRSCINASTIVTTKGGEDLANLLARRWAAIRGAPLDDETGVLAGFPDPNRAALLSNELDEALKIPGATDVSADARGCSRVDQEGALSFVLPTVVWATDPEHPLVRRERPFPVVTIVQIPEQNIVSWIGPTLSATVVSGKKKLIQELTRSAKIHTLHVGSIPTTKKFWGQPHEGNLFELLFAHRAVAFDEAHAQEPT